MMSVTFGTDTYGRVKSVGGTPIVTKFFMLQFLPLYPVQSYYFTGVGRTDSSGVPFIAVSQEVAIDGLPLARFDVCSVAIAYVRGAFAALTLIGCISIFPIVMYFTGSHFDNFAANATCLVVGCFVVGTVGGVLTYLVPTTPRRERRIRRSCGQVLGICVDPARVFPDTAVEIEEYTVELESESKDERSELIQQLVKCRSRIAQGIDTSKMEHQSDAILDRLDQISNGRHNHRMNRRTRHSAG
jgi:hypothetical protein